MGRGNLRAIRQLLLTSDEYERMRTHVNTCLPLEACGLLAGKGRKVLEVLPITNRAASPARYRMDPIEQLRAFEWIDTRHLVLLAIFHSHPAGPEGPSATDIAEAAYPVAQLIWSCADGPWKVRGFWIADGRVSDVKLNAADGE